MDSIWYLLYDLRIFTSLCQLLTVLIDVGKGIPVAVHSEHNIYVPELIFGHLLTSSNYDDNEKKGMLWCNRA